MSNNFNTKKRGLARTIIFKSGSLFKAVCLDFDIIEEAKTREDVERQIREAIIGYIKNICKNNLNDELLNRHAEKRYWNMYYKYLELLTEKNSKKINTENFNEIAKTSFFTMPINSRVLCGV